MVATLEDDTATGAARGHEAGRGPRAEGGEMSKTSAPDPSAARPTPPPTALIVAAFFAVYVIWGSTYYAIKVALETLPTFLTAGVRFAIAGGLLLGWAKLVQRAPWPTRREWGGAAVVGTLMLLGGNGGVMWAEGRVPSGLASVLIAMVPIFMALLEVLTGTGRPNRLMLAGILVGFGGVVMLVLQSPSGDAKGALDPAGAAALLLAAFLWAAGSLLSRKAPLPGSPVAATACEMLAGGAALGVVGALSGEASAVHPAAISARSLLAVGYLVVFGSIIAFSAYVWLLRVVAPTRVGTYAYVNPVVALLLGAFVAGETIDRGTLQAVAVIVVGVVLSVSARSAPPPTAPPVPSALPAARCAHGEG